LSHRGCLNKTSNFEIGLDLTLKRISNLAWGITTPDDRLIELLFRTPILDGADNIRLERKIIL